MHPLREDKHDHIFKAGFQLGAVQVFLEDFGYHCTALGGDILLCQSQETMDSETGVDSDDTLYQRSKELLFHTKKGIAKRTSIYTSNLNGHKMSMRLSSHSHDHTTHSFWV
eukprot:scaffold7808_cov184-Amphora_coffeaeformis.AAC.14